MIVINQSLKVLTINEKFWQFDLWHFPARIHSCLSLLIGVRKFQKKLFLTLTVGLSCHPLHNDPIVANSEQYNKGTKWI